MGNYVFRLLMATGVVVAVISGAAHAATTTATARGKIIKPVTLTNGRDLNFGTIVRGTTAGTVSINARTAARTRTGGAVLLGNGATSAAFTAGASAGQIVRLTLAAPTVTISNGLQTMPVNTFRISVNGANPQTLPRNVTVPATAILNLTIGARLMVAANQADGDYQGNFVLTMNYQ